MSKDLIIQNTAIVADDYNQWIDGVKKVGHVPHIDIESQFWDIQV